MPLPGISAWIDTGMISIGQVPAKTVRNQNKFIFIFANILQLFVKLPRKSRCICTDIQKNPWKFKGFTELLTGIGPVTSALPMRRSTDWATAAFISFRSREPCIYYHEGRNLSTINFKKFLLNLINLKRTQTMLLHYCHIRRDNQVSGLWICMAPSAFRASTMEETLSWGIYNSFDTWYVVGVYPCLFVNSFI